ncbi:DR2241 family protein [Salinibaculum rarum]|uniref:DR2241 family protein n=1 Tax=Salinibaculum rarum TaxID=3058903 RepID=UPI00265DD988|nr:DR2241 family protein [Salinibaculum sp. KK48]
MTASQFDALVDAAETGLDSDTLTVDTDGETYDFAVPDGEYSGLSESELREAAAQHREYVAEWYFWHHVAPDAPERRAFLRWVERSDDGTVPERHERLHAGTTRRWGQLRIRVQLAEAGRRTYQVRHVDDEDEPVEDLAIHTDPLDAREIRKYDDDGRYRPLSTAPTLGRGWVFVDLTAAQLVSTVDTVYPATVANWYREREGELDVTHWHEAVSRQTGIYGVVETWDRGNGHDHVEWVAEACCDDSQCLKRREWEYDEETPLDVDGGAGRFPCREPCSLVVSAARKWTRIDAEDEQTYEFELTPSEKEQVEEIIDAVAEGRADEIREADFGDGANRWRARFLRAKRFDEDGNLGGVLTERPDEEE